MAQARAFTALPLQEQETGMATKTRELVVLGGLIGAWAGSLLLFGDGIGIVVFLAFGLSVFVQLVRVTLGSGKSKTLKQLWDAFKDAFWGIG